MRKEFHSRRTQKGILILSNCWPTLPSGEREERELGAGDGGRFWFWWVMEPWLVGGLRLLLKRVW